MKKSLLVAAFGAVAMIAVGAAGGRALYQAYPVQISLFAALLRNTVRSWGAPPGATATEPNPAYTESAGAAPAVVTVAASSPTGGDWPSYNRTLASDRYAPLAEINAHNVG